jgi:hypothetical protein
MSAWKEGLQSLYKATPSKDIQATIVNVMRGAADDRSAALSAAALADTGLMVGIAALMRPKAEEMDGLFWDSNAKWGTFYKRIQRASALGLIGPITKSNLDLIREVRNAFAHAMIEVAFTTPEISAACDEIVLPENAQFFVDRESERRSRYRFCYGCDDVFRGFLTYVGHAFITGIPPVKTNRPVVP